LIEKVGDHLKCRSIGYKRSTDPDVRFHEYSVVSRPCLRFKAAHFQTGPHFSPNIYHRPEAVLR
jgi:hypothetical protein